MKKFSFYWVVLKATASKWSDDKAPSLGAALAFYSMLSLGPMLLLLLTAAAFFYGQDAAQGRVLNEIDGLIGHDGARAVQDMLAAAAQKKDTGIFASIVGMATLLIGASGVFGQLQDAMNTIWNVKPREGQGIKQLVLRRFFTFTMVLGTGFLLLVSLLLSTVLAAVSEMGEDLLPEAELVMGLVNAGVSFGVVTFLFASIFKYMPDTVVRWRDVWLGAAITAALFTLGKFAIGLYLGHSALSSAYGASGSLVVMLVWVYYSAQILFFGAEFTHEYARIRNDSPTPRSA